MGLVMQIKEELLAHLRREPEQVTLTCEGCECRWTVVGPFELRHPVSCPGCDRPSVIHLERQVDLMAAALLEQLGPPGEAPGQAGDGGCGSPGHRCPD